MAAESGVERRLVGEAERGGISVIDVLVKRNLLRRKENLANPTMDGEKVCVSCATKLCDR